MVPKSRIRRQARGSTCAGANPYLAWDRSSERVPPARTRARATPVHHTPVIDGQGNDQEELVLCGLKGRASMHFTGTLVCAPFN